MSSARNDLLTGIPVGSLDGKRRPLIPTSSKLKEMLALLVSKGAALANPSGRNIAIEACMIRLEQEDIEIPTRLCLIGFKAQLLNRQNDG